MKKTDTCYYMSITKEENSAFVVANHQTGTGATEPSHVVVESKTDGSAAGGNASSATAGAGTAGGGTGGTLSTGSTPGVGTTMTSIVTPTTTLSGNVAAATAASGGNGTIGIGVTQHLRYTNGFKVPCDATRAIVNNENGESVSPGKPRTHVPPPGAPPPPQVILQVPSTPTPRHHNLLASDFHRECRMRLAFFFLFYFCYLFFFFFFLLLLSFFFYFFTIKASNLITIVIFLKAIKILIKKKYFICFKSLKVKKTYFLF